MVEKQAVIEHDQVERSDSMIAIEGVSIEDDSQGCISCAFHWNGDGVTYCLAQSHPHRAAGERLHAINYDEEGNKYGDPINGLDAHDSCLIWRESTCPLVKDMGEISDGYHTFNQLYHQRAVLFATIVNQNKDNAWKSWKHEDGKDCFDSNGEWFIVGVDTPEGSYTYHYSKEYWSMFECQELECGKHWDGHTEEDVTRLLTLRS